MTIGGALSGSVSYLTLSITLYRKQPHKMNAKKGTHQLTLQEAETIRRVAKELAKRPEFAPKINQKLIRELATLYGSNRTSVYRILTNASHNPKE